jgi:type III restriction enzyme
MDGRRQLRRYVPELDAEGVQDLPPEALYRFCLQNSDRLGKTWGMAMAMVWAPLHARPAPAHRRRDFGPRLALNRR